MAYVRLDSSILDLPDDAGPWGNMSYQEITDVQANQVDAWNAQLAAEVERRMAMSSLPEREVVIIR